MRQYFRSGSFTLLIKDLEGFSEALYWLFVIRVLSVIRVHLLSFCYATLRIVVSVLLHRMKIDVCFSAHTSKRIAKVIIVVIWFLALSLAAPMAMSWEVILEDELDPGMCLKLHTMTRYKNILYFVNNKVTFCLSHHVRSLKLFWERV